MFRITRKVDLGMVAIAHLAKKEREASSGRAGSAAPPAGPHAPETPVTSARELAESYGIPPFLVSNILKTLAHRGLITSVRGAHGGYVLRRRPHEISLGTLIEALEGPLKMADCCGAEVHAEEARKSDPPGRASAPGKAGRKTSRRREGCSVAPNCPTSSALRAVEARIRLLLDAVTFDQILDNRFACPDPVAFDVALPDPADPVVRRRAHAPSRNHVSIATLMSSLPIQEERP